MNVSKSKLRKLYQLKLLYAAFKTLHELKDIADDEIDEDPQNDEELPPPEVLEKPSPIESICTYIDADPLQASQTVIVTEALSDNGIYDEINAETNEDIENNDENNKDIEVNGEINEDIEIPEVSSCHLKVEEDLAENEQPCLSENIDLEAGAGEEFLLHHQLSLKSYELLLSMVENKHKVIRNGIPLETRIPMFLQYLSQGMTLSALAASHGCVSEKIRPILFDTANLLDDALSDKYLNDLTGLNYSDIQDDYWLDYQIPNCIGVIAGVHLPIRPVKAKQANSPSLVLLASCDAKLRFINMDIGAYGKPADCVSFYKSAFGKAILKSQISLPKPKVLPGTSIRTPVFFIANSRFPLAANVMTPYQGILDDKHVTFNDRLVRAHSTIDNAFGILFARWRILQTPFNMAPERANKLIRVCILLHNFIMTNDAYPSAYCPLNFIERFGHEGERLAGQYEGLIKVQITPMHSRCTTTQFAVPESIDTRDKLCDFFNNCSTNVYYGI